MIEAIREVDLEVMTQPMLVMAKPLMDKKRWEIFR